MKRNSILAALAFGLLTGRGVAATLTIPSFTVTTPPSTSITCSAMPANLVAPVAAGTVLNTCTVSPSTWQGAVALSLGPQLVVTGLSGNTFSIAVGSTPLAAGAYAADTVTSTP